MVKSFSSNAYTKKTLSYAIKELSNIGYHNIEIVADAPHAFLPLKQSYINSLKKNLQHYKFEISNLNANTVNGHNDGNLISDKFEPSLSNFDPKLRKWRVNYSKQAIDLAQELDIPSISITSHDLVTNRQSANGPDARSIAAPISGTTSVLPSSLSRASFA